MLRAERATRAPSSSARRATGSAELHAALVARGFAATAISGDRAQAERDRALEQLRRGDARVLVATNVAARGLHLPDVDLIVHADLPLNAESLTHRSGRTGRAGRKGTAVRDRHAPPSGARPSGCSRAAQVKVDWTPPPVGRGDRGGGARAPGRRARRGGRSRRPERRARRRRSAGARGSQAAGARSAAPAAGARARPAARRRAAARRPRCRRRVGGRGRRLPGRRAARAHGARTATSRARASRFRVNLGAKDRADPRWLLPLICRRGGVTRREVGAIRIGPQRDACSRSPATRPTTSPSPPASPIRARATSSSRAPTGRRRTRGPTGAPRPAITRPSLTRDPSPRDRTSHPARRSRPPAASAPARAGAAAARISRLAPRSRRGRPRIRDRTSRHARRSIRGHTSHRARRRRREPRPPARAPEPPRPPARVEGGYHPLQRRTPRQNAPEHPRSHQQRGHTSTPGRTRRGSHSNAPGRTRRESHTGPRARTRQESRTSTAARAERSGAALHLAPRSGERSRARRPEGEGPRRRDLRQRHNKGADPSPFPSPRFAGRGQTVAVSRCDNRVTPPAGVPASRGGRGRGR